MPTLHLLPDSAHTTAQSLKTTSITMTAYMQELTGGIRQLDSSWQGGDKDAFSAEMELLLRNLTAKQEELNVLATRLEREIAEWEETDQRGASAWQNSRWEAAWRTGQLPLSAGGWGPGRPGAAAVLPLMTAVSLGSFLAGIPTWLRSLLERLFPPAPLVSPIPDDPSARVVPGALHDLFERKFPAATESPPAPASPSATPAAEKYDLLYDVPAKSQGDLYGSAACLPTSMSMVTEYYHGKNPDLKSVTPEQLVKMMDASDGTPSGPTPGIGFGNLNDELAELGYSTNIKQGTMDTLSTNLNDGPVIVNVKVGLVSQPARDLTLSGSYNHSILVKGMNSDSVVVNDPWSGTEKVFSRKDFEKIWSGGQSYMALVRPTGASNRNENP